MNEGEVGSSMGRKSKRRGYQVEDDCADIRPAENNIL
jgi:hypothetical protein